MHKYSTSIILVFILMFAGCTNNNQLSNKTINVKNTKPIVIKEQKVIEVLSMVDTEVTAKIVDEIEESTNNVAIIFSSQIIGKYAINATNSAISYLISQNNSYTLKVFDIPNEDLQSIEDVFLQLADEKISKVLILFTQSGASKLMQINNINSYDIYLPLIHKNNLDLGIDTIIYGSIDYTKQFDKLLEYTTGKYIEFHDNSQIGHRLVRAISSKNINLIYQKEVDDANGEYRRFLRRSKSKLSNATLIVNMPIVKSSIILSQINANDIKLNKIISTQLNYTPLLLSLTQTRDRKNMIIANSIGKTESMIEEYVAMLDNDIVYNWVNYSSIIGLEYLINKKIDNFQGITLENNQIQYPIKVLSPTKSAFELLR